MKPKIVLYGAVFLLGSIPAILCFYDVFGQATQSFSQQQFLVAPKSVDIGKIRSGEKKRHLVTLHNKSSSNVRILHIQNTCGCTSASVSDGLILPGGSTELSIMINAKDTSDSTTFHQQVSILYSMSENPSVTQTLRIDVHGHLM